MFSNHSRPLLLLGFIAVMLLMMAVVFIGFKQMSEINRNMELIVNKYNAKTSYITSMYAAGQERAISILRMLDMDDAFERDEEYLHFNQLATRFAVARMALNKLDVDEQENTYSHKQSQLINQVMPQLEIAIDLLFQEKKIEATRLLLDEAIPAQEKVLKQLSSMLEYQEKAAKKSLASAKQSYQLAIKQISLLALGAFIISMVIAWVVIVYASRAKEALFSQVALESIGDAVITTDAEGSINYLNSIAEKMTGWNDAQAKGKAIIDVFNISEDNSTDKYNQYIQEANENAPLSNPTNQAQLKNLAGDSIAIEFTVAPIVDKSHKRVGTAIAFRNMNQEHELRRQLSYQACHDSLTGLINRYEFEKRLNKLITSSIENNTTHALLYLDLDAFKVVNDTCGHVAGDELLKQLPLLLHRLVRNNDTIARLGGDEFGMLLNNCRPEKAQKIAEKILHAVQDFHFIWEEKKFRIGVSIGVVKIDKHSKNINNMMSMADAACYSAKDSGRNRIYVAKENDGEIANRHGQMQWVSTITKALEDDSFELFYQTIVATDRIRDPSVSIELLLRMRGDDGNLIPPGAFIPAAERYNLMIQIDRWVINHAFKWLSEHPEETAALNKCAINLSGQSIGDKSLLDFIKTKIKEYSISSEKICFEITETAAISNLVKATWFIHELKNLGCFFSLDDFGSGLSSFAYLKNLPVDFIKIDGMFVRDITHDPIDKEMVRAITSIAQAMGKLTVAEFVENDTIKDVLREIGVDYLQGYGVTKPRSLALFSTTEACWMPTKNSLASK